MLQPFDKYEPYRRVTQGETTAADRQWLRFLSAVFEGAEYQGLVDSGIQESIAREFLGVVALDKRYNSETPTTK